MPLRSEQRNLPKNVSNSSYYQLVHLESKFLSLNTLLHFIDILPYTYRVKSYTFTICPVESNHIHSILNVFFFLSLPSFDSSFSFFFSSSRANFFFGSFLPFSFPTMILKERNNMASFGSSSKSLLKKKRKSTKKKKRQKEKKNEKEIQLKNQKERGRITRMAKKKNN